MKHILTRKFLSSIAAVAVLFVIIVLVNYLAGQFYTRVDITEDKLYTLSSGTEKMVRDLPEDVTIKLFYSSSYPNQPPSLKNYASRVKDLLEEYANHSGASVHFETYDPKPDSTEEEWAQKYGLAGSPINPFEHDTLFYFGLVAEAVDQQAVIPFLDPQRERFLEYDVSRMIYEVTHPDKKKVAIMSSLPVTGTPPTPFMVPGQPRPEKKTAWVFVDELRKSFDVVDIATNATDIAKDIDLLVLIHPKQFSDETQFAIDQHVLNGGKAMFFVDPFCNVDARPSGMGFNMPGSSDLNKLFKAWGFEVPEKKGVIDMRHPTTVSIGSGRAEKTPAWITADEGMFDKNDIMCAQLDRLLFPVAGRVEKLESTDCEITPLVQTSTESMEQDVFDLLQGTEQIRKDFVASGEHMSLASKVRGTFKTAFPDGAPGENSSNDYLKIAVRPNTIVVIADVDLLADQFNFQEIDFFGYKAHRPFNNNMDFVLNGVDQLCGDEELISIRSRAKFDKPFTVVDELEARAQEKWMAHEKELSAELQNVRMALRDMQAKKDESQRFIISAEQQKKIKEFENRQREIAKALKEVRKSLRKDIDELGFRLKFYNMALVPLCVCFFGIGLALHRYYKIKRSQTHPQ